jgi:hypothetical protein
MSDTHLQNLEKAMNIAYEKGDMESAKLMAEELQAYSISIAPEEKTLTGFGENLATDAANLGGAVVDMVASPLDTAGAVTDLAVTGATNLLPKSVVDDLYSYEDDPSSMQYKLNEFLKSNKITEFLATQPRESYEQMGEVIAEDVKSLIDDPVGRAYKKPLTSLLEATGLGRVGTTVAKTGKFGNTAANVGSKVDNVLDYVDPVSGTASLIGKGADFVKDSQMVKYSQNIIKNKGTELGTKYGFKILPSTLKDSGGNLISKAGEKLAGQKRTSDGIIDFNVKHADKLLRKHAGVTESTALGKVYDTLAKKSKPFYDDIAKLQGKNKRVRDDKIVVRNVKQKQRGASDRTVQRQEIIEGTKTVQDIQSGQSILNKIESQKKINKKAYKDSRKESSKVTQEVLDENATKLDNLHNELDRTIAYNKSLAEQRGASAKELKKFDSMASNLKKARKNYAIGHSIENALNPDGTINLKKYANANRNNAAVTGQARAVIDFYDTNPTLFKQKGDYGKSVVRSILENPATKASAVGAATLATPFAALAPIVGGSVFAADLAIPSILRSNIVQKGLLNKPRGNDVLNVLSNKKALRTGVYTPSLLDSSNMEYLPELQYMQGNQ